MLPIRIVHIPRFRSTRPVWMYHELKNIYGDALPPLDITTFTDIPSFRVNKPQWLLDMNPNGKVPTMAHDNIVMFEGGAICSYLLDRFDVDRKLLPRDGAATAMYYQMVSWCASTIDNLTATSLPHSIVVLGEDRPKPMDDVEVNQKYFDEIFAPYLCKMLSSSGGPHLCGENFTAVDVIAGYFLMGARDKIKPAWIGEEKHPELNQYLCVLFDRPAMQQAIAPVA